MRQVCVLEFVEEPHSINDYKVALVRLGVKLPTGQRSKAEYQQLYDEVQQRQQGKRKQPMTPTEHATESQAKQAKQAKTVASQPPRTASAPRACRPRADAPAQQPTPPAQPQASGSTEGRPAAQRPAPAPLPRPAAVPPRQPAAVWMPARRPAAAVAVPPSLPAPPTQMFTSSASSAVGLGFTCLSPLQALVPPAWAVAPVSVPVSAPARSADDVWRERPWRAAVALLTLLVLGGAAVTVCNRGCNRVQ